MKTVHGSLPALNEKPFLILDATGVQIYQCEADSQGATLWKFKRPKAVLQNGSRTVYVDHGDGPSWTSKDGSEIVGSVIASVPSPQPNNIPWLQLNARNEGAPGVLSDTKHVERIDTKGGLPDPLGCTHQNIGQTIEIPYTAVYLFYHN